MWKREWEQERDQLGLIAEVYREADLENLFLDDRSDLNFVQFVANEVLHSVHGSWNIEVPTGDMPLRQSLVGKRLMLGADIEMIYITPPGVCFGQLSKAELDWFGRNGMWSPVLRAPVVSYRSLKEGWRSIVLNDGLQLFQGKLLAPKERGLVSLKILIATAEIGDIGGFCTLWKGAKKVAVMEHEELLAISIAKKMIPLLERVHPHPKVIVWCCYFDIGQLHESLATRLIKKGDSEGANRELLAAALAHKVAADKTREFYPSTGVRSATYNALGLCLMRLNDLEMAKRSYMWALTDRWLFKPSGTRIYNAMGAAMAGLWMIGILPEEERDLFNKENLKNTRSIYKKELGGELVQTVECQKCHEKCEETVQVYSRCSRCMTPYCSRECQLSDWQDHKKNCRENAVELQEAESDTYESGYYDKYTQCPESTRELIAASNIDSMHFTMPLASWIELMEKMKTERATGEREAKLPL